MKKTLGVLIAIILTTIFLVSALQPLAHTDTSTLPDSNTVDGVLGTDTYTLYPYDASSYHIGYSKYGEMIDPANKIGQTYKGVDPFAPKSGSPPEYQWIEGWVLNVTYVEGGLYKNLWALATYSDYVSGGVGGNWQEGVTVGSLNLTVRGGRKTSGGAVTDPIQVIYDGPRDHVALLHTTIYETPDHLTSDQLLSLTFTIVFNKASKEVVIYKDVKRIDIGKNIGDMQVEFGDRGEWDLGSGQPPKSYATFQFDQPTVYDGNYQPWYNTTDLNNNPTNVPKGYIGTYSVCQILDSGLNFAGFAAFWPRPISSWVGATQVEANRPLILTTISTITEDQIVPASPPAYYTPKMGTPIQYPQNTTAGLLWTNKPMVFVDGFAYIVGSTDSTWGCSWDSNTNRLTFMQTNQPAPGSVVRMVYKVSKDKPTMAQAPESPFIIGEWCFVMNSAPEIFRGVTVYGLTDRHDGDDASRVGGSYVLDRELKYQLDQVFLPWDLNSAIEKKTSRWVEFGFPDVDGYIGTENRPVVDISNSQWDQYNQFAERIIDENTSTTLHRRTDDPLYGDDADYSFYVDADGYGWFYGLNATHYYKILYSTANNLAIDTTHGWIDYLNYTESHTGAISQWYNATAVENRTDTESSIALPPITDNLGATHQFNLDFSQTFNMLNTTATNGTVELTGTLPFSLKDVKVWKENQGIINWLSIGGDGGMLYDTATDGKATINLTDLSLSWTITPPIDELEGSEQLQLLDLHIDSAMITYTYDITVTYWRNTTNWYYNTTWSYMLGINVQEHVPGRWEWGIVGRDAYSVDSAGLSMVSAAFKEKQVEYGLAGADMYTTLDANNYSAAQMPWVMSFNSSTGASKSSYYYGPTDYRTGIRDDWCTTWPITSSNMIGVGGPIANLFSYYGNDFSSAIWGNQFANSPWANTIIAVPCWNKMRSATLPLTSNNTVGYGVISTFQDPNGTVGLLLYGVWGRDTYYLTKWFLEDGIYELQQAPRGLTSIVVQIKYKLYPEGYKPTGFQVVECLGTISERLWKGTDVFGSFTKGGIHDP